MSDLRKQWAVVQRHPALTFRRAGIDRRLAEPVPHVRIELVFQEVEA